MCIQKLWWKVLSAVFLVILFATACKKEDSDEGSHKVTRPQIGKAFVEQTSLTTAKVTWQAAVDDATPHEQMGYEVHFSEIANFIPSDMTRRTTMFGVTEVEVTGLETGKTYYVLVVAVDKQGERSQGQEYQAVTISAGPALRQATRQELETLRIQANTYKDFAPLRSYLGADQYRYQSEDAYIYFDGNTQQSVYIMIFKQTGTNNNGLLVYGMQIDPPNQIAHAIILDANENPLHGLYVENNLIKQVATSTTATVQSLSQPTISSLEHLGSKGTEIHKLRPTANHQFVDSSVLTSQATNGSVSGMVRADIEQDGVLNGNERGINDVIITLRKDGNGDSVYEIVVATTTTKLDTASQSEVGGKSETSVDGVYRFTNLLPGSYQLVSSPPNYVFGPPMYTVITDKDGPLNDGINFTITSANENLTGMDFLYRPVSVTPPDGETEQPQQCGDGGPAPCPPSELPANDESSNDSNSPDDDSAGDKPSLPPFDNGGTYPCVSKSNKPKDDSQEKCNKCYQACNAINSNIAAEMQRLSSICAISTAYICAITSPVMVFVKRDYLKQCADAMDRDCDPKELNCDQECERFCNQQSNQIDQENSQSENECDPPGGGWGDPHLYTPDGLAYDFQGVGEFVFTKSTVPGSSDSICALGKPY